MVFKTPVSIADNPKINQWLSLVEKEMRLNLATLLARAVDNISKFNKKAIDSSEYLEWVDRYQAQLVVLASQIAWSSSMEAALQNLQNQSAASVDFAPLQDVLKVVEGTLNVLADSVLQEQPPVRRKKLEHLVSQGDGYLWCTVSGAGGNGMGAWLNLSATPIGESSTYQCCALNGQVCDLEK